MSLWFAFAVYLVIAVVFGAHDVWKTRRVAKAELIGAPRSLRVVLMVVLFVGGLAWPLALMISLLRLFPVGRRYTDAVQQWIMKRVRFAAERSGDLDTLSKSPRWWSYTATRLAHFQPGLLLLLIAADLASSYPRYNLGFSIASNLLMLAVFVSIFAECHHERRLCARCATATPADGAQAAASRRRWLRFRHWHGRHPMLGVALCGAGLVLTLALHIVSAAAYYPLYLYWFAEAVANLRHRPVQPWCPQCKGWGWGDGVDNLAPTPVPSGQRRVD